VFGPFLFDKYLAIGYKVSIFKEIKCLVVSSVFVGLFSNLSWEKLRSSVTPAFVVR
jgi:hypothetical protein